MSLITGNLIDNIEKLHTTIMGAERIKRNLGIFDGDVVLWCKNAVKCADIIIGQGKNFYAYGGGVVITVNAYNYCIITAHKIKAKTYEMAQSDYVILEEFLYQAIYVPNGVESPARDIIYNKKNYIYVDNFGKQKGDYGVVAEIGGQIVGAAWTRIISGYGHYNGITPELAISILPEFRGYEIGTKLLKKLFSLLKQNGYKQISLSVQKSNIAVEFFKRTGFKIINERPQNKSEHQDYLMLKNL